LWTLFAALFLFTHSTSAVKRLALTEIQEQVVPAEALALGAEFHEAAPPKLKKWCNQEARKKELRENPDLKTAAASVDRAFPNASGKARGAATFMLLYSLYTEESRREAQILAQLRDRSQPLVSAEDRQMPSEKSNAELRSIGARFPTLREKAGQLEEIRTAEEKAGRLRLEQARSLRELAKAQFRVAAVLKILDAVHPRAKLLSATVLEELR
jgi:hypothetical protein